MKRKNYKISICKGIVCRLNGSDTLHDEFEKLGYEVEESPCKNYCQQGPNITTDKKLYTNVKKSQIFDIIDDNIDFNHDK